MQKLINRKPAAVRKSLKRGSALVTVCIFSALILLIAGGSIASITFQTRSTGRSIAYKQSLALAEAGAEVALATLNTTDSNKWTGWTSKGSDRVLSDKLEDTDGNEVGTYTVTVINASSDTPLVSATGTAQIGSSGPVTREIRVPVKNNTVPSPFGSYGIYSNKDIDFGNNNQIEGASAAVGNISVKNPKLIGNLQAGGTVTGNKIPDDVDVVQNSLPTAPPGFPEDALQAAKISNDNHKIYKRKKQGNQTVKEELNVPLNGKHDFTKHDTIVLPAGTYYLDNLAMASNTYLEVEGPVKLYLDPGQGKPAINLSSGKNYINHEGDPTNLHIYVKSGTITFGQNFEMWAGLYAPGAQLAKFKSNTWLYGAIIGNDIALDANSGIFADPDLLKPDGGDGFLAEAWTELPAPD